MTPCRGAQYLLRLDDLCPTMDRDRWGWFAELIASYDLKPILAVVPENRDPELMRVSPDAEFWLKMQRAEAAGAAIGLHGFRHVCRADGNSLVPVHGRSEFAGVPYAVQQEWIGAGLRILRQHCLEPKVWVAPRHGFDAATCRVLKESGIGLISDGWAQRPFRRYDITWIPQQLWAPVEKRDGLWTICLHPNTATEGELAALRRFLDRRGSQFTSLSRVLGDWRPNARGIADRCFHWRMLAGRRARRWSSSQSGRNGV